MFCCHLLSLAISLVLSSGAVSGTCSRPLTSSQVQQIKNELLSVVTGNEASAIRLSFHDCVDSCDGCLNLNDPRNFGAGFASFINSLNNFYAENGLSSVLSRADLYALAGIVAVEQGVRNANQGCSNNCLPMPNIPFGYCRQDCPTSPTTTVMNNLPSADLNNQQTLAFFQSQFGLTPQLATALMGAHTMGGASGSHGSGFLGSFKQDTPGDFRNFNNKYYQWMVNQNFFYFQTDVSMYTGANSSRYQWNVYENGNQMGMVFNTDMSLIKNVQLDSNGFSSCSFFTRGSASTANWVRTYANNPSQWIQDFSTAFGMMIGNGNTLTQLGSLSTSSSTNQLLSSLINQLG